MKWKKRRKKSDVHISECQKYIIAMGPKGHYLFLNGKPAEVLLHTGSLADCKSIAEVEESVKNLEDATLDDRKNYIRCCQRVSQLIEHGFVTGERRQEMCSILHEKESKLG
jgi:hypothetical protein